MNTLILSLDNLVVSQRGLEIIKNFNLAFTIIFAIEMGLKLFGIGPVNYARDPMNIFDGVIVILSLIELFLLNDQTGGGGSAFSAFRLLIDLLFY